MDFPLATGPELDAAARRRIALSQVKLRIVNEGIDDHPRRPHVAFVCECGRIGCNQLIMLARSEYEAVRANPRRFVVAPGHEVDELERVVERHAGHAIVETRRPARDIAEGTDPRAPAAD